MKLRHLRIEIFTGSDPDNLTNGDGTDFQTWRQGREEQELLDLELQDVGGEAWLLVEYTKG